MSKDLSKSSVPPPHTSTLRSSTENLVLPRLTSRSSHEVKHNTETPSHPLSHTTEARSFPEQVTGNGRPKTLTSAMGTSGATTRLSHEARTLIRQQSVRVQNRLGDVPPLGLARRSTSKLQPHSVGKTAELGSLSGMPDSQGTSDSNSVSTALVVAGTTPVAEELEKFDWMSLIEDPLKGRPKLIPMDRLEVGRFFYERDPDTVPDGPEVEEEDDDDGADIFETETDATNIGNPTKVGTTTQDGSLTTTLVLRGTKLKKLIPAGGIEPSNASGRHFSDLLAYDKLISFKDEELDAELSSLAEQRSRWDRKLARLSHQAQERQRALLAKDQYLQKLSSCSTTKRGSKSSNETEKNATLDDQEISKLADMLRTDLGSGQGLDEVGEDTKATPTVTASSDQPQAPDDDDAERIDDYFGFDVDTMIAHRAAEIRLQKQMADEKRKARRVQHRKAARSSSDAPQNSPCDGLDEQDDNSFEPEDTEHRGDEDGDEGDNGDEDLEDADDADDPLASLARLYKSWGIDVPTAGDSELETKNESSTNDAHLDNPALAHLLERRLQGGLGAISAQMDDLMRARNELLKNVDLTGLSDDELDGEEGENQTQDGSGMLLEHHSEPISDEESSSGLFVTASSTKRT